MESKLNKKENQYNTFTKYRSEQNTGATGFILEIFGIALYGNINH